MEPQAYRSFREDLATGEVLFAQMRSGDSPTMLGMVVRAADIVPMGDLKDPLVLTIDGTVRGLPDLASEEQIDTIGVAFLDAPLNAGLVSNHAARSIMGQPIVDDDPLVAEVRLAAGDGFAPAATDPDVEAALGNLMSLGVTPSHMLLRMRCADHNNPEICDLCG